VNELERYLFDLHGFLVVEDALTIDQITALNQALDEQIALVDEPGRACLRFDGLLPWGKPFQSLIDNPRITPYLETLLGVNARLDHQYVHIIRYGTGPIGSELHGGGTPYDPCQYYLYKDGRMYNGLTAVAYQLTDVFPGEGGFGCIPGSHKSNLPLPRSWINLENPVPCVREIVVKAGAAIIFTEALTHGTMPWRGARERRTLFYKYSPYPSTYSRIFYDLNKFPELTDAQRRLLKTPGVDPPWE
jgi:ectoine hydroxylase-related dioxygenase (phytanoyl-CoA dioxygenase family)